MIRECYLWNCLWLYEAYNACILRAFCVSRWCFKVDAFIWTVRTDFVVVVDNAWLFELLYCTGLISSHCAGAYTFYFVRLFATICDCVPCYADWTGKWIICIITYKVPYAPTPTQNKCVEKILQAVSKLQDFFVCPKTSWTGSGICCSCWWRNIGLCKNTPTHGQGCLINLGCMGTLKKEEQFSQYLYWNLSLKLLNTTFLCIVCFFVKLQQNLFIINC